MKNNLKIDYLGWVTLIIIVITTTAIYSQLSNLRSDIKLQSTVKVQVKDNEQLEKLSNQFMQQWGAKGYCFYIYQPNSPIKTHKELASSNLTDLPLRLSIDDYRKISKSKIDFGQSSKLLDMQTSKQLGAVYIRVPIYQFSVVVGEFYLFYNDTKNIDTDMLQSISVETQIINKLLQ